MHPKKPSDHEVLLVAALGPRPFSDSVFIISPDGSSTRTLLPASRTRSYTGMAAVSLAKPIIVQVSELKDGEVDEALRDYHFGSGKLSQSCWNLDPKRGIGVLSRDGQTYASPDFPALQAGILFMRCTPKTAPAILRYVDKESSGDRSWYISPAWSPTGRELAAVKVWRNETGRGLITELHLIEPTTMTRRVLLSSDDGVVAVSIAPDGRIAVLDKAGIEVLNPATGTRQTVLAQNGLKGRRYMSGGMAWLTHSNSVVLSLVMPAEYSSELWKISVSDGSVSVISKLNGVRVSSICSVAVE